MKFPIGRKARTSGLPTLIYFLCSACVMVGCADGGQTRSIPPEAITPTPKTELLESFGPTPSISLEVITLPAPTSLPALLKTATPASKNLLQPIREGEFVTRVGSTLMLSGNPFRFLGNNAYYLQPEIVYGNLAAVSETLDEMVELGMPVVRTIGFNDTNPSQDPAAIQTRPGFYNETSLVALDQVIAEAKARNIRVILYLTNNWDAYGGIARYRAWCECGAQHHDFFTNETLKQSYREYVTMLLNRTNTVTGIAYKDEPAILAWELGNELRNPREIDALVAWHSEMARHIKSIDPNHLVADGGEGFDDDTALYPGLSNSYATRGSGDSSFHRLLQIPDLDMVSYHLYPEKWGLNSTSDVATWIQSHDLLAQQANKVTYLGEVGIKNSRAEAATILHDWLALAIQQRATAGTLVWGIVYDARPDYDGFSVYCPKDKDLCETAAEFARRYREP